MTEKADPDRLECPSCEKDRQEKGLGLLVLPAPIKREQMAARLSVADPWSDVPVLLTGLYPTLDGSGQGTYARELLLDGMPCQGT